eukprot:7254001-Pyramimonas_sp.AAC.1
MGVVDMRPVTDEDLVKVEDELYSDEELDPRIVEVATTRKTRVGGAPMEKEDRRTNRRRARRPRPGATPCGARGRVERTESARSTEVTAC